MNKKISLIGYDLEVFELLTNISNIDIIGYVGDRVNGSKYSYLGKDDDYINNIDIATEAILAMDNPRIRKKLFALYRNNISMFISHPDSKISKSSTIEPGTVIQDNVLVSAESTIGKGCFLNHSSALHHESCMGDFSILAPSALILGRVKIGYNSYIGAGAVIREHINIGSNVIVGAGSVVVKDIPDNLIVAGNPSKTIMKGNNGK